MQLKILRVMAKLTQAEVAKLVGVNQATVSDWENGLYKPSQTAKEKLANAYGVDEAEIVMAVEATVNEAKEVTA